MKTNKQIAIEELKKIHGEYMVAKALATLSGEYYKNKDEWKDKFFEPLASNLLSKLHLEEKGVVIFKGPITLGGDNGLTKYAGKKGKLIFIEEKMMDYKKVEKDIVDIILQHQAFRRLNKYENIAKIIANDVANYIKALIEKNNK